MHCMMAVSMLTCMSNLDFESSTPVEFIQCLPESGMNVNLQFHI